MDGVLVVMQWLHILGGITWFGGYIFLDLIVWPALLRLPAGAARQAHEQIFTRAAAIMTVVAPFVVVVGILRGTWLGPIKNWRMLIGTPYGVTWLVGLVVACALMVWGATWHSRILGPVWEGDAVRGAAVRRIHVGTAVEMSSFGLILTCMVLMGVRL